MATLDLAHTVRVYDAGTGAFLQERRVGSGRVTSSVPANRLLAFSPDSRFIAVAGTPLEGPSFELLDSATLVPVPGLGQVPHGGWSAVDIGFSSDGSHLYALLDRHDVGVLAEYAGTPTPARGSRCSRRMLSCGTWRRRPPPSTWHCRSDDGASVALDARGRTMFSTAPLVRHDLRTGTATALADRDEPLDYLTPVADGTALVGIRGGGSPLVLDSSTGARLSILEAPASQALHLSPDGRSAGHGQLGP